ncbi:DUF3558 domain-containing protein [Amycolatopsis sp. NPDC023774]|uniref:DUF3558 domain-containing protein n=1 Tax=Amycolatopsis sp. NPDC023774 TaxID=3155015 RepID=UPI0033EF9811
MISHRVVLTLSATAVVLAATAGCSGTTAATPTTTPPPPSTKTLPHSGAPKVEHPLPASVLSGDPCQDGLTADQIERILGTAAQGERDDAEGLGPACNWHNTDTGAVVGVGYSTQPREGLSAVYAGTKSQAKIWQVLPAIQGFPAVAHSTDSPGPDNDLCQVSVGVSDELAFDASVGLSQAKVGKTNPCDVAATVADMVVTNLRQKAGG